MHNQKSAVNPAEHSAVHGQGARPMMRLGGQRLTAGGGEHGEYSLAVMSLSLVVRHHWMRRYESI